MAFAAYSAPVPVEHPAVTREHLRQKLAQLIDTLLSVLDDMDGDPDLEPSLGSLGDSGLGSQSSWAAGDLSAATDEREQDHDLEAREGEDCLWPEEGDQTWLWP